MNVVVCTSNIIVMMHNNESKMLNIVPKAMLIYALYHVITESLALASASIPIL